MTLIKTSVAMLGIALLAGCVTTPSTSAAIPEHGVRFEANASGGNYQGAKFAGKLGNGKTLITLQMLEPHPDPKWSSIVNVYVSAGENNKEGEIVIRFQNLQGSDAMAGFVDTFLHGDLIARSSLGQVHGLFVGKKISIELDRIDAHHMRYSVNDSASLTATETPFALDYLGTTTSGAHTVVTVVR